MGCLPTGTVTFLFTDIEGSTRLLQRLGDEYAQVLEGHARLLRTAVEEQGGVEVSTEGDSFFCVFPDAVGAVAAAVAAQQALASHRWPANIQIRVRMGLHTGQGRLGGDDYVGLDVHRGARIAAAGHGGQVLLSKTTQTLVAHGLSAGVSLRDLGEQRLEDLDEPEQLYQLVIPGLEADFPPLHTLAVPHNLPVQLTSFIGRDEELAEVAKLLRSSRLLTLTGAGGTGKTRLALQVAAEVAPEFPGGVFFVPLASIRDPQLVPSAIAAALHLRTDGQRDPFDLLVEHLGEQRLLLLLDNFEQVLAAGARLAELLRAAPSLTCLVTSRAPLQVSGEQEFAVPPLRTPDPSVFLTLDALARCEAVALFVARATAAKPGFRLAEDNALVVAELTARLEGLPLALELAAARVKLLPPRALLERLDHRLKVLTGGPHDLPARQQTLRGTIAWSYELLDEPARRMFRRLAVFRGGAMLGEIEVVCGPAEELGVEALDALAALVDHSLLRTDEAGEQARLRMLETICEFAHEQLEDSGEAPEIRRRHVAAYRALAEQAEEGLEGESREQWLGRLETEHDNLRAALTWAAVDDPDVALRLAASLWRFWQLRGHLHEASERLSRLLAWREGDAAVRARALEAAGGLAYWRGRLDESQNYYEDSLATYRALNERAGEASALYNLSYLYALCEPCEVDKAQAALDKSLRLFEELGDEAGVAKALYAMGHVAAWVRADYERAKTLVSDSIELFRKLELGVELVGALGMLGSTLLKLGDLHGARRASAEGLELAAGEIWAGAMFLYNFVELAAAEDDFERALRLYGALCSLRRVSGADHAALTVDPRTIAGGLPEEKIRGLIAEGEAMSLEEAVAFALHA